MSIVNSGNLLQVFLCRWAKVTVTHSRRMSQMSTSEFSQVAACAVIIHKSQGKKSCTTFTRITSKRLVWNIDFSQMQLIHLRLVIHHLSIIMMDIIWPFDTATTDSDNRHPAYIHGQGHQSDLTAHVKNISTELPLSRADLLPERDLGERCSSRNYKIFSIGLKIVMRTPQGWCSSVKSRLIR